VKPEGLDKEFVIIGENIHCTRRVKRGGNRTKTGPDGHEYVVFEDEGHGFTKRQNEVKAMKLAADWLERHLTHES